MVVLPASFRNLTSIRCKGTVIKGRLSDLRFVEATVRTIDVTEQQDGFQHRMMKSGGSLCFRDLPAEWSGQLDQGALSSSRSTTLFATS